MNIFEYIYYSFQDDTQTWSIGAWRNGERDCKLLRPINVESGINPFGNGGRAPQTRYEGHDGEAYTGLIKWQGEWASRAGSKWFKI